MPVRFRFAVREPARVLVAAACLALALSACGRRGALEPPPDPNAPVVAPPAAGAPRPAGRAAPPPGRQAAIVADDEDEEVKTDVTVSPLPTVQKRSRAYVVPKEPFFLDPLL